MHEEDWTAVQMIMDRTGERSSSGRLRMLRNWENTSVEA